MKTYFIQTFGCQMNKHDSERVSGLLENRGLSRVETPNEANVVVFMTCCVREKADERLMGQVASLKALKTAGNDVLIAVGGCIGQRDGVKLIEQMGHIDVVFGTQNIESLPMLLEAAHDSQSPQVQLLDESDNFASDLPTIRERSYHAWLPITVGCDNFCTYCVVPYVRGRERSRKMDDIVAEAKKLVEDGVVEITLLGQNVNSYGRDLYGAPRFSEILSRVADTGIKRISFATSHPKDLTDETIEVMASTPACMNYLHLPFQSGSDAILTAMNRIYTRDDYLKLIEKVYDAMPDIALSTDVIVGFPGETEQDFEDTLSLVRACKFDQAFTFIYSPREGTPAATMANQVPAEVAQKRFQRLVEEIQASAFSKNQRLLDTVQEVLVEGPSKRNKAVLTGRSRQSKVVHFPLPEKSDASLLVGKTVNVKIETAQTWFLTGSLADMDNLSK
ncbi:MAG: tRNA (N6-isopentenyl adenosine(37)-C2)-methylthiotransferase MiaB [Coriobacteriia bacterium]|nr:tRNA (N6-isopentenyl adenosine(37)-C2)-methylthiotransferase MiaB [Coriobacteriia bacterium]